MMGTWNDEPKKHEHDYRRKGRPRFVIEGDEEVRFDFFHCRAPGKCDRRDKVEISRTKVRKK